MYPLGSVPNISQHNSSPLNRTPELKRSLLPTPLNLFDCNTLQENMLSAFFPAQVFAGGRVTGGYSGVKKSKPEPEVEVLRKACLCFSEAIVSKEGEVRCFYPV